MNMQIPERIGCCHDYSIPAVVRDLDPDVKDDGNFASAFQIDAHARNVGHRQIDLFSVYLRRE